MKKTALVTGANRGLGLEFVRQYAAEGWRVLATARRDSPELTAIPGDVTVHKLDVTDFGAISRLADGLRGQPIDVLINNAGYLGQVPFERGGAEHQRFGRVDYADWELVLRSNVLAPMRFAECFIEHIAASTERKIVALTSILGSVALNTTGGLYCYRSSKAALNAVMKSMAIDIGRRGVLAVALHPGWVRTDMGGSRGEIDVRTSVTGMRRVIASLGADQAGQVYAYDGSMLPY